MHLQPMSYFATYPPGKDGDELDGSETADLNIDFVTCGPGNQGWNARMMVSTRGSETAVGARNLMVMRLRSLADQIERSDVG